MAEVLDCQIQRALVGNTHPRHTTLAEYWGITLSSNLVKKLVSCATVVAVAGGIALSTAGPSSAAVDGMTNNWTNWWTAHAEVWVFNPSQRVRSIAHLGNTWFYGAPSNSYSWAEVTGYSWTHEAYQIRIS
ncbi:hypothetical protein ACFRJ9_08320 [Paenarthrobacter sp. NPDC056912]|uniref:hypothetical protein n=1 Tax=Paenarthrobacter sp. NPDC056912 TaxID=3345965 RepID=UPI00366F1FE4